MLSLSDITKIYNLGDISVHALDGVSINFRSNEFVSILGPSGGGKTTLLNIIGGLDQYTSGDLIINGKSTKDFRDRDWDAYRNHSVGFVFQSYNLIPHQSVLQNVELALTLSGVSKSERRKRAAEALEKVGLGNQLKKKPNQLSGGQMQRVAIARALVNDPDILLADEPTGALDTETSVQVMDILKEVSKDRLVIMVTHNPELAEKYSTRIIRILDGKIIDDSMPLSEAEISAEKQSEEQANSAKKVKKPSMSLFTSFGLSLKNLFTKKGRTLLTSFAGSIGIIGIALIYAVSQGMTMYIDKVQEDTLTSYPLTLEAQHVDLGTLLTTFMGKARSTEEHENDAVYQKAMVYELVNSLNTLETQENDLKSFKAYLEKEIKKADSDLSEAVSGIQYTYSPELLVYTKNVDGEIIRSDSQKLMQDIMVEYMGLDMSSMLTMRDRSMGASSASIMNRSSSLWQEMLPGNDGSPVNDVLKKQYDMVYGSWPTKYNEIVLVLDENNELNDLALYALGLKSKEDIDKVMRASIDKTTIEYEPHHWSYKEICDMEYRTILNSDCYTYDEKTGTYTDLRDTSAGLKYLYDNATALKVSGIIKPNEDAVSTMITGSIGYTNLLTQHIIENSKTSAAVEAQLKDENSDIFTGLPFKDTDGKLTVEKKSADFKKYVDELNENGKAEAYIKIMCIPDEKAVNETVEKTLAAMDRAKIEEAMSGALASQMSMGEKEIADYLASMSDEDMNELFSKMIAEQYKNQYAEGVKAKLSAVPNSQLAMMLTQAAAVYTDEQCAKYYDEVLEFSESSYSENLSKLGCVDLEDPTTINIYAATFAEKDIIEDAIAAYNDSVDDIHEIAYTDYVGLMMSSITTIINAITYVLIAFVSVSLIVSSIMIGVITLISVQERTKEIGILRAIGASKKNVSSMFNAETVIIGFAAGTIGVLITYLLCIPINLILHSLTGIQNLSAYLPPKVGIVLIVISILLTLLAGIIPSRSAAKKDPVIALRTE